MNSMFSGFGSVFLVVVVSVVIENIPIQQTKLSSSQKRSS